MKKEIFRDIKENYPQEEALVDRLIVSSFLIKNSLSVNNRSRLNQYVIDESDAYYPILEDFITTLNQYLEKFDFESLIEFFEFVISPSDKIITGAVYTPKPIRDYIVNESLQNENNLERIKICDPACGCGGFLYNSARFIKQKTNKSYKEIFRDNIYGLDIQAYSTKRTEILLTLLTIYNGEDDTEIEFNLFTDNALSFNWADHLSDFDGFEYVLGNPPYVCSRNIDEGSKKLLKNWEVCSSGHPDLYIPFFQIGLENLKPKGTLSFITMNTFFKSINGRALRSYFQDNLLDVKITDFGSTQIFLSKSTYTCIVSIVKQESQNLQYRKIKVDNLNTISRYISINFNHLNAHHGWNMHHPEIIAKIEDTGTPFGKLYKTSNGIATLKNDVYFFHPVKEDNNYYYLQNGATYPIEKEVCKDIINPNKFTKADNIDDLKRKAIFPYQVSENGAELIKEEEFEESFPLTYNYLSEKRQILSTRDKGNGQYEDWYAYGRNQALERFRYKLFFPHIAPSTPNYVLSEDQDLLFHNGLAVISNNRHELLFLQKLMATRLFWFYIQSTSKPYGSGYFSLSRNYVKGFGVYNFSVEEQRFLIEENSIQEINAFVEGKYGLVIPD